MVGLVEMEATVPNRILRDGILTSERVNELKPHSELFYRRLMSVVDDYGRYSADPRLLRASCYPLRLDEVREADISRWLTEVESAGLVALYAVDGKNFLQLLDFRQQTRAKTSKYPQMNADAQRMRSTCAADAEHVRTYTDTDTYLSQGAGAKADEPANDVVAGFAAAGIPDLADDPHHAENQAALAAFERWSSIAPTRGGRGQPLDIPANEHRPVFALVGDMAQDTIPHGGTLVGRHLLIPQAVDAHIAKGTPFKDPRYACGCVKRTLADWAREGIQVNGKNKPSQQPRRLRDEPLSRMDCV
jgi:hypothetical protein